MYWEKVLYALSDSRQKFSMELGNSIKSLNLSVKHFSEAAGLPPNTVYKVLCLKERDPRLSTVTSIIHALRKLEERQEIQADFVAVLSERSVIESIKPVSGARKIEVRAYPAADLEEALIQGVRAEKHGAKAIVCGPVTAHTLGKILRIPIITIGVDKGQLSKAIATAISKAG